MFERFTAAARTAVRTAAGAARAAGTHEIGVDHLLAALLPVVPAAGLSPDAAGGVLADLAEARRRAGLSEVDARALASSASTSTGSWPRPNVSSGTAP